MVWWVRFLPRVRIAVSRKKEDELLKVEEAKRRPKEIWSNLAASVKK